MKSNTLGSIIIAVILVGMIGFSLIFPLVTQDTVTMTIKDKERITKNNDSYYLVYTEGEVYKNDDCLILGKFDSSDIYSDMDKGKTYEAEIYGWRVPFLSMYKNIVSIKELEDRSNSPVE